MAGFFFTPSNSPPASAAIDDCVWLVESEIEELRCSGSSGEPAHGCTGDDHFCITHNFDSAIHTTDPGGGVLGQMFSEPDICQIPQIKDPLDAKPSIYAG